MELTEFMRTPEVSLNGITGRLARAVVVVGLFWSGNAFAQDFRFGPPGGDSRGFDRGDRDRSDRDRGDRDRSDRDRRDGNDDRGRSFTPGSSSSSATSPVSTPTRVRVTVSLQSSYAEIDTDRDGQIGLYEWRRAQRPLAQFTQFDANRDGFLTPRELERAATMPAIAASTSIPAQPGTPIPSGPGTPMTAAPVASLAATPPAAATPAYISKLSEEDLSKADEAQAKSVFSVLDKNKDGRVSAEEMAVSSRVRPLFEQAGLNFNEPMAADQFVSNYVRIQKGKRT